MAKTKAQTKTSTPEVKNRDVYEAMRRQGYTKESATQIANASPAGKKSKRK